MNPSPISMVNRCKRVSLLNFWASSTTTYLGPTTKQSMAQKPARHCACTVATISLKKILNNDPQVHKAFGCSSVDYCLLHGLAAQHHIFLSCILWKLKHFTLLESAMRPKHRICRYHIAGRLVASSLLYHQSFCLASVLSALQPFLANIGCTCSSSSPLLVKAAVTP